MIANPLKQGKDARRVFSFNKVFGTNVTQRKSFLIFLLSLIFHAMSYRLSIKFGSESQTNELSP